MQFQILDLILIVSLVQLVVFVFFLVKKKPFTISNKILAFFLFVQIVIIINLELLRLKNYLDLFFTHSFHLGTPFYFLPAPIFYFYIKSRVYKDFSFSQKDILHVMPFILVFLAMFIVFYHYSVETKLLIMEKHAFFSNAFALAFNGIFSIQFLIYFWIDLKIMKNYRNEIKQVYSSVDSINLTWISYLIYGFMLAFFANTTSCLVKLYLPDLLYYDLLFIYIMFFIFFNYIYYKGFSQPEIFAGIESKPKYISSNLAKAQAEEYLEVLQNFMAKEKPYLKAELTLKELSEMVSISQRHLSQIINENLHENFYDFIGKYRIEEAKQLLSENGNKTILEILYSVGFNSKSSFNSAFKKFTGTTPTRYKNSLTI